MPAETLTREKRGVRHSAISPPPAEARLSRKDLAGMAAAALVVLAYVANVQGWWYLGSNHSAAVTMVAIGAIGCPLGARLAGENLGALPVVLLGLLGVAALTVAVLAIVTAAQWTLLALAILVLALWAGTTVRHAKTPPPRLRTH